MRIGVQELLLILLIVLILFGAKRVPDLAKSLGRALREFRNAAKDIGLDDEGEGDDKAAGTNSAGPETGDERNEEPPYKA